jgi:hypothetical protein
MPKLCLRSDQDMETNSSTDPWAVQKPWTIRNRYGQRYAQKCIPPAVSLSDGRHLTRLRDLRPYDQKTGYSYLGPDGDKAPQCRQIRNANEEDQGRRGTPACLPLAHL